MSQRKPVESDKPDNEHLRKSTLTLACERNQAAFAMLYEEYRAPLGQRLFALVNDREAAYDLYQETFMRAWQAVSPTVEPFFQQWLYTIARNVAIDYLRHAKKITFVPLPEDEESGAAAYGSLLYDTMTDDTMMAAFFLRNLLGAMSPQYRTCLLLQLHWGYTQAEIAGILGISEKSVSTNVSRGYRQVRKLYSAMMGDLLNDDDQGMTGKGER